jgi:uncharacterized membrane protein required for colicin V production
VTLFVDVLSGIFLAFCLYFGFVQGLSLMFIRFLVVALLFPQLDFLAVLIGDALPLDPLWLTVLAVLFILLLQQCVAWIWKKFRNMMMLTFVDRLLGALAGILVAVLVLFAVFFHLEKYRPEIQEKYPKALSLQYFFTLKPYLASYFESDLLEKSLKKAKKMAEEVKN